MTTLSEVDLMQVTGGKVPDVSIGSTGSSSSNNDAILASLTSIQNSLKDVGKNNNSLFGGNAGLMFAMAICMSRRNDNVVYVGGGGGCGGYGGGYARSRVSFRWRASW